MKSKYLCLLLLAVLSLATTSFPQDVDQAAKDAAKATDKEAKKAANATENAAKATDKEAKKAAKKAEDAAK